mgnify:CR=1 FL=1
MPKPYNLSVEDVLNLMAIKGGTISDLVDEVKFDDGDKAKKVHELASEISLLNEILFEHVTGISEGE